MPIEFRTGFFGFNRDDVLDYVRKKDADFKNLTEQLGGQIDELRSALEAAQTELAAAKESNQALTAENEDIKTRLAAYEDKVNEINTLSTKIGKLYLVSKSSARSIMDKAEESSDIIKGEAARSLANIENTQKTVGDIANRIVSASKSFVSELDSLHRSLEDAKHKIADNGEQEARISEEFAEIYEKLS